MMGTLIDSLDQLDKQAMLFLNYDGNSWTDSFWFAFSDKFTWIPTYFFILFTFYLLCKPCNAKWKQLAWLVICTVLIIVLADQISSGVIKHLVERPRPSHSPEIEDMLHYVNGYKGGPYGFVSSHAANSIGLALWLVLLFKGIFRSIVLLWAFATCYSRIYLGVHYLGDILGGLVVGVCCALVVYFIFNKFGRCTDFPKKHKEPWLITSALVLTTILIAVL